MEATLILLNDPHINTAWAVSTAEQISPEGGIYSVFPYVGQKKIGSKRIYDISLPLFRRQSLVSKISKFTQIVRLKNSAVKSGETARNLGNLSYIQRRISKIVQEVNEIKIISDYSYDDPNNQLVHELLNLLDYFCKGKKIIPITIYCKKDWYSESENYKGFWNLHTFVAGKRKTVLVMRPNWVNCGSDTHTRNLLKEFTKNQMAYIQLLISPSTTAHQEISPYRRTGEIARLNDFVHVLTRFQLIKIAIILVFKKDIENSVVLTHQLIYSMSKPKFGIAKIFKENESDFIFVTHYFNIKRAIELRKSFKDTKSLLVCDTHDIQSINFEQFGYRQYLQRRIANLSSEITTECEILDQCDHLIFLTGSEQSLYENNSVKRVPSTLFIPRVGIDTTPSRRLNLVKTSGNSGVVLIVMSNNSGNQLSIEWFVKEVLPLVPSLKVRIVGSINDYAKSDPSLFQNNQLEFTGVVKDLVKEYRDAGVIAVPVVRGAGIAIKTLEALAYGKPIVATPLGLRGIQSKLSKHLIAQTPAEFAKMLIDICESRDRALLQQSYSQRLQKEIAPKMNIQKVLDIFQK